VTSLTCVPTDTVDVRKGKRSKEEDGMLDTKNSVEDTRRHEPPKKPIEIAC